MKLRLLEPAEHVMSGGHLKAVPKVFRFSLHVEDEFAHAILEMRLKADERSLVYTVYVCSLTRYNWLIGSPNAHQGV